VQKPSEEIIGKIKKRALFMTLGTSVVFGGLWVLVYVLTRYSADKTMYYYTSFFQIVLLMGWCFFIYPFMTISILLYLYGIDLNEKTAKRIEGLHDIADPKTSKLVKHFEAKFDAEKAHWKAKIEEVRLDFNERTGRIEGQLTRIADSFTKKIEAPKRKIVAPVTKFVPCDGHGKERSQESAREVDLSREAR